MPSSWFDSIPPPPEEPPLQTSGLFSQLTLPIDVSLLRGAWFTDASGGENSAIPLLRRVAWSIVLVDDLAHQHALEGVVASALAGRNQTVNRGELAPIVWLAENTSGNIAIDSDSKYVVMGLLKGKHMRARGKNADLWASLGQALLVRAGTFHVNKVPAHMTVDDVVAGTIGLQQFIGNSYADAAAGRVADLNQVPGADKIEHEWRLAEGRLLHKRILAATKEAILGAPAFPRNSGSNLIVARQTLADRLQEEAKQNGHTIKLTEERAACRQCCQCSPLGTASAWTSLCCKPFSSVAGFTLIGRDSGRYAGNTAIHGSHSLIAYKGLLLCTRCGAHAAASLHSKSHPLVLRRLCLGRPSPGGALALNRFAKGQHPALERLWPDDMGESGL